MTLKEQQKTQLLGIWERKHLLSERIVYILQSLAPRFIASLRS